MALEDTCHDRVTDIRINQQGTIAPPAKAVAKFVEMVDFPRLLYR